MPPTTDPRVDAYLAEAETFARPILTHLRYLVHRAVPDAVETIKWGMPFYTLGGTNLCHFAAFKAHAAFGFWRRDITDEFSKLHRNATAMGAAGRITALSDLPAERTILAFLKRAAERTRGGTPPRAKRRVAPRRALRPPADLAAALKRNLAAATTWAKFSYSHRKEYVDWLTDAKRPETRARRLAFTVAWLAEGKSRNWRYEYC